MLWSSLISRNLALWIPHYLRSHDSNNPDCPPLCSFSQKRDKEKNCFCRESNPRPLAWCARDIRLNKRDASIYSIEDFRSDADLGGCPPTLPSFWKSLAGAPDLVLISNFLETDFFYFLSQLDALIFIDLKESCFVNSSLSKVTRQQ